MASSSSSFNVRPVSGLARSWTIQRRVVGALVLREIITRYGRHNIGILWLVVEPMLFTLGVAALWHFAKMHTVTQVPVIAFAVTGYSTVLLWRNVSNRCAKAIEPNLSLMYHRNVRVLDIFLSRAVLEIAGATASLALLTILFCFGGAMRWPSDWAMALGGWLLLCWFAVALGLIVGAISERSEVFERIWHIVTYLMFPLSGAVYMVHWLPSGLGEAALWVPMVHGVELLRGGYFGGQPPTYGQPGYFALVNALMTLAGLALVQHTGRSVKPG